MARKIPAGFSATATVDADELAEAVKRLAVVAARDTPVRLAITPGQIELTAGSGEEADGTDTIGCELDGDPLTVAFHPQPPAGRPNRRRHQPRPHRPDHPGQGRADHPAGDDGQDDERSRLPAPAHAHPQRRLTPARARPIPVENRRPIRPCPLETPP